MNKGKPEISIVAAAYNEAANIEKFHAAVRSALGGETSAVELIFVDDGSTDTTASAVRALRTRDPLVRLVRLSRNFGNQAAFLAGIRAARGQAVITLDCDLQHPPAEFSRMIAAWRGGARVVQMVRRKNPDAGWLKRATSRWFHRLLEQLTDLPLIEGAGDFRLLDRSAALQVLKFSDSRPFYRGMVSWLGAPSVCLEYQAASRTEGRSGIGWRKRLRLSLDAITALSIRPLRLALLLGCSAVILSLGYALFVLVAYIRSGSVAGYPTIIFTVTFLGAVQLISIGVLGEYIGRIYEQSRQLPPYVVVEEDGPAEG
jgi:glycosyltransferase involved in cell wall biosynthesis